MLTWCVWIPETSLSSAPALFPGLPFKTSGKHAGWAEKLCTPVEQAEGFPLAEYKARRVEDGPGGEEDNTPRNCCYQILGRRPWRSSFIICHFNDAFGRFLVRMCWSLMVWSCPLNDPLFSITACSDIWEEWFSLCSICGHVWDHC